MYVSYICMKFSLKKFQFKLFNYYKIIIDSKKISSFISLTSFMKLI